ncbi:hypothetical protein BE21_01660 [Sorangium cellulosum]|uniref:Peptidase C14 caspase domain-containing protein n=1 Tax=Sorangium cellulosum TaxID=56 RepID=A0A150TXC9_SORCE|nr:hypothetical protein BE21_01660 [Sorangium cellulosum]
MGCDGSFPNASSAPAWKERFFDMSIVDSASQDEPALGNLYLFPDLPDDATQRAFIGETLATIREHRRALQSAETESSRIARMRPRVEELQRALRARLTAATDVCARFEEAVRRSDAREAGRLFRDLVIARLETRTLRAEWDTAMQSSVTALGDLASAHLAGGARLRLVAQTGHSSSIRALAFSHDGSWLVTAGNDGRTILWEAAIGRELFTWQADAPWHPSADALVASSLALTADGQLLLVDDESGLLFRFDHRKDAYHLNDGSAPSRRIAFSSDGSSVATTGAGVVVWSNAPRTLRCLGPGVARGSSSVDRGLALTVGPDHRAILHDDAKNRLPLEGPGAPLSAAALSADGERAATLDAEGRVDVWDARNGRRLKTWKLDGGTQALTLSRGGRLLLTWSKEAGVRLWDIESDPPAPRASVAGALAAIAEPIRAAGLSPSAAQPLLVVGTESGALWAIDATRGDVVWSVPGMRLSHVRLAFSADGRQLTVTGEDGAAHRWDLASGRPVERQASAPVETPAGATPDSGGGPHVDVSSEAPSWTAHAGHIVRDPETGEPLGYYESWGRSTPPQVAFSTARDRVLLFHKGGSTALLDATRPRDQWLFKPTIRWSAKLRHVAVIALSPDGRHVVAGTRDGVLYFRDDRSAKPLCQAIALSGGRWAVADDEGRYDAPSGGGVAAGFHWVLDLEPITLDQLKARYYDPFLLAKKLGLSPEPLRDVTYLAPKLFPAARLELDARGPNGPTLHLWLIDRGGGIGPVRVSINDKEAFVCRVIEEPAGGAVRVRIGDRELLAGARRREDGALQELAFSVPLARHPYLLPTGDNRVTVVTTNHQELLVSRDLTGWVAVAAERAPEPPHLWAIVVGVASYADPSLRLRYAAKDAEDIAAALQIAGAGLFGEAHVHVKVLSTERPVAEWPTRANVEAAFSEARGARSDDVLVLYLAGHGAQLKEGQDQDFCFLTQDAVGGALADSEVRRRVAISSHELTAWIQRIPALKQVLLLDTCHAGQLVADWSERRELPSSHVRAIERMKDRMGLYVLAGAAAGAVSYEASRYAQGLLTYALLFGMRGPALREGRFVDVHLWLTHAIDQVPRLAARLGGVQRPLLAVPRGGATFDVGAIEPAERGRIPLAIELPLLVRAGFQDEDEMVDTLGLGELVDEALRDLSASASEASFVFVEVDTLPGACKIVGRYRVERDAVAAAARLVRGRDRLVEFAFQGRAGAAGELARAIAEKASSALRTAGPGSAA